MLDRPQCHVNYAFASTERRNDPISYSLNKKIIRGIGALAE